MKRLIIPVLIILFILTGCDDNKSKPENNQRIENITSIAQLREPGRRIGVPIGSKGDTVLRTEFLNAEPIYSKTPAEGCIALLTGKIDAYLYTRNELTYAISLNPDLYLLDEVVAQCELAMGLRIGEDELLKKVNTVVAKFYENGIHEEMSERWLTGDLNARMPEIEQPAAPEGKIIIGICDENPPTGFLDENRNPTGFDIEYAIRLAKELNMEYEFTSMIWDALIPSLKSGKVDLIIANLTVTEERKEAIAFSDVYNTSDLVMMARKPDIVISESLVPTEYDPKDLSGKDVAVVTGMIHDKILLAQAPDANPMYFNDLDSIVLALKNKQVYAVLTNSVQGTILSAKHPGFTMLTPVISSENVGIAVAKGNHELQTKLNEFIAMIKADGTFDDMLSRWLETAEPPPMPEIPEGSNGVIKFATSGISAGFSFIRNGKPEGVDVEFAKRFAAYMDMKLEITVMDFAGLIPSVSSGKVDFAANLFAITEERMKSVGFSDPYYSANLVVCVYDEVLAKEAVKLGFWETVVDSINRNLIYENRWLMIVDGLAVSLIITLFAFILATLLGFVVCGMSLSRNPLIRGIARIYINILRGTPVLVLLMITFYVIFAKSTIPGILVAIIAFGLNGASFIGEIIRSAILTVDKGQVEAARSMGFSKIGAFFTVTFPQAVRVALPVYKSEFVSMFKMTSVVGYIAIVDLTKAGDIIRARTYDAFFPLLFVALVYLIVASLIIFIFDRIDKAINKRLKRGKRKEM